MNGRVLLILILTQIMSNGYWCAAMFDRSGVLYVLPVMATIAMFAMALEYIIANWDKRT